MEVVFKKSPKKPVNKVIAWCCSLGYFAVAFIVIALVFTGTVLRLLNCVKNGFNFTILTSLDVGLLIALILIAVFLIFCLNFFEWFFNPVFLKVKDTLVFKSDDVIAALGRATTTYTIKSIISYKVKKTAVIIRGTISVKEPLGKSRDTKKCEVPCLYDSEDKDKVLDMIKEFCNEK